MNTRRDILVIDDEPVIVQVVVRACSAEGLKVDVAEDAGVALRKLSPDAYGLIVCDIMMPGLNGFEFLAEVARLGIATPVVMATGYSTTEYAVQSLARGAIDFLPKPFTADELLAVARRGLRWGQLCREGARPGPPPLPGSYRLGYVSWAAPEPDGTARVGVHAFFVRAVGPVRGVAVEGCGAELAQGAACATVTGNDGLAHTVMGPLSGRVLEVNTRVTGDAQALEKDSYCEGWLYRVLPSDLGYDLGNLAACPTPGGQAGG